MVTLDTLLIASCISFGSGVLTTLGFGLLVAIVRNTRAKEDEGQFAIPLSSLVGGPPGGGGGMSLMDMYRHAQASQAAGNAPPPPESKKDEKVLGGTYL